MALRGFPQPNFPNLCLTLFNLCTTAATAVVFKKDEEIETSR
jgi:hypothetical protein